jgi:drug/metabolite transporter (DMT)-like permease
MFDWLIIAAIAQIIFAFVAILDKYIVTSKTVLHPFSYAFYVCMLSGSAILIFLAGPIPLPFGIQAPRFSDLVFPTPEIFALALVTGLLMYIALVNMYEAFSKADTSDVVPVIAAISAFGTLALEFLFLSGSYSTENLIGMVLLIAGTLLVSQLRFDLEVFIHSLVSGLSFSIYYALIKHVFNIVNFDTGFLYTRLGMMFAAILVICIPAYRKRIFRKLKKKEVSVKKATSYVVAIKTVAGIASIMSLKAIQLGSVAVVQAMAGLQFLILILFSALFGKRTSINFGENDNDLSLIVHKIVAAVVISAGLFYTFMS